MVIASFSLATPRKSRGCRAPHPVLPINLECSVPATSLRTSLARFWLTWRLYNGVLSNGECALLWSEQQLSVPIRTKSLATLPGHDAVGFGSSCFGHRLRPWSFFAAAAGRRRFDPR